MPQREIHVISGTIIEQGDTTLTIEDLSRLCAAEAAHIAELVEEGILPVIGGVAPPWRFPGAALRRAPVARRLQRALEKKHAGVARAHELLDEIEALRRRIRG